MRAGEKISAVVILAGLALLTGSAAGGERGSRFERAVLAELNFMRGDPGAYADELGDYRRRFDGLIVRGERGEADLMTREGTAAVTEAMTALRRASAVGEMDHGDVLAAAAADHVNAQGRTGQVGHVSNGRDPGARVVARGGGSYVGEVIAYGGGTPRAVVRQLIVDDGVANRGHRILLLDKRYRYAGVACGPHPKWRTMCVVDVAETPDGSAPPPRKR